MSTVIRLEHSTEAARPTTPGTDTGSPATEVATPSIGRTAGGVSST